ncbi:MAG: hypothetical protein M1393_08515 [Candidatus Thermoplasmatota archaeon]|nr:hypothetical protein [Candidatus Thermoplasmatota archaeon]MDA8144406.1 hypothetical protein [Thermoplasmatales archaeon]
MIRGKLHYQGVGGELKTLSLGLRTCCCLVDATIKNPYPPTSLPKKEYKEAALNNLKELNLPKLSLAAPWHGYELEHWPEEFAKDAMKIVNGNHYDAAESLSKLREKV